MRKSLILPMGQQSGGACLKRGKEGNKNYQRTKKRGKKKTVLPAWRAKNQRQKTKKMKRGKVQKRTSTGLWPGPPGKSRKPPKRGQKQVSETTAGRPETLKERRREKNLKRKGVKKGSGGLYT